MGLATKQTTSLYLLEKTCQAGFHVFLCRERPAFFGKSFRRADLRVDIFGMNIEAAALKLKGQLAIWTHE